MTRTINTANIGLITYIKAVDEGKDKTIIHTKAVKGAYTKEINNMEETKE